MSKNDTKEFIKLFRSDPVFQAQVTSTNDGYIAYRIQRMVGSARSRSHRHGLPCDITEDDICIPDICPVLGIPLFFTEGKSTDNTPSLDKIAPILGYVKNNIAVVSKRCNRLKNDATPDALHRIKGCSGDERKRIVDYVIKHTPVYYFHHVDYLENALR